MRTLCLPAEYSTVKTWIQSFGLQPMPGEDLDAACKDQRLLIFPGTQVLHKQLLPPLLTNRGPLMIPPWAEELADPPADGRTTAAPSSQPRQAPDAEAHRSSLLFLEATAEASAAAATAVAAPSDKLLPLQAQPETAPMPPPLAAAAEAAAKTKCPSAADHGKILVLSSTSSLTLRCLIR